MMEHRPSTINIAKRCFEGYLAEEELQERQYEGRYWDLNFNGTDFNRFISLYVLLDNDTVLWVFSHNNGEHSEHIRNRTSIEVTLPETLIGRYYN